MRPGDRCGLRRLARLVGDIDGDGVRDGVRRCFRGVNGEPSGKTYDAGGGSLGYVAREPGTV